MEKITEKQDGGEMEIANTSEVAKIFGLTKVDFEYILSTLIL